MTRYLFIFVLLFAIVHAPSIALAQKNRPTLSPREAQQKAEERFGGKALSAEPQNNPKPMYKIKIIQEGRVKTVLVPATE